jgi:hypothetical protein
MTCSPSKTSSSPIPRSDSRIPTGSRHGSASSWADVPSSSTVTEVGSWPTTCGLVVTSPHRLVIIATVSCNVPSAVATCACSLVSAITHRPGMGGGASFAGTPDML